MAGLVHRVFKQILSAVIFICASSLAFGEGDRLLLDIIQQEPPNTVEGLPRPHQGMTQQEVRDAFGEPVQVTGPVGKPAITRWEYGEFLVIFEGASVVRAVPKPASQTPAGAVAGQE